MSKKKHKVFLYRHGYGTRYNIHTGSISTPNAWNEYLTRKNFDIERFYEETRADFSPSSDKASQDNHVPAGARTRAIDQDRAVGRVTLAIKELASQILI
jgi:hypothetical protein